MSDQMAAYDYLISRLKKKDIKYKIHESKSGAKMIDIWYNSEFYVIQIEDTVVGWSHIKNEEDGFNSSPDLIFKNYNSFIDYINLIMP